MLNHYVSFLSDLYLGKFIKVDNKTSNGLDIVEGRLDRIYVTGNGIQFVFDNGSELYSNLYKLRFVCVGGADLQIDQIEGSDRGLYQYLDYDVDPYFTQFFLFGGDELCVMLME